MTNVSIIVPTYNEKENMRPLFERIHKSVGSLDYEIVIVDDNSSDGTIQEIKKLSGKYPVRCIVRKNEKGLATAVVKGFKNAKGNILVVMDADLQHPPERLMPMITETLNGVDIAVGSRYIGKNGFGEFSFRRKVMSKGANVLAKILFPKLSCVNDIQSGFFSIKKDVIKNIDLKPTGYKILIEILMVGKYKNVVEIPYTFSKRESGESKLGTGTIVAYLQHMINIFWRQNISKNR